MKKIFYILILISFCGRVYSQDLHFSQYFNTPLLVNPANTGFSPGDKYRIGLNYRNQWANLMTNPYKTFGMWGDIQLLGNKIEDGWLGVGGNIMRDAAGTAGLTSTGIHGTVAYHQLLGYASLISAGFGAGWVNKRIDPNKLTFDSQWNGKFFDIAIPSGEVFANSNISYFDMNAGINYAYFPNNNTYLNAGISVQHINKPKESFLLATSLTNTQLNMRYSVFLNGSIKLNDRWIINPNVYYTTMADASETVLGINAHYNLSGDGDVQLIGGLYYRNADSFIPMVGYQWSGISLTVNYDATVSSLKQYNQSRGAYEISLIKAGVFSKEDKSSKCPAIKF